MAQLGLECPPQAEGRKFQISMLVRVLKNNESVGAWLSLARVPALGAGGRWFESSRPDHLYQQLTTSW